MNCSVCGKETMWLEHLGKDFICHRCINKNKLMGKILRTHNDSFHFLIKKLSLDNYNKLMDVKKEDILKHVKLGKVLNT